VVDDLLLSRQKKRMLSSHSDLVLKTKDAGESLTPICFFVFLSLLLRIVKRQLEYRRTMSSSLPFSFSLVMLLVSGTEILSQFSSSLLLFPCFACSSD
jgi:hypothetical protein